VALKGSRAAGAALASGKAVSHLTRFSAVLLLSTLAACGGKSNTNPGEGDGGTGAGGSGSGGSGHAGTGSGGTSVCASFDDDYAAYINVSILNQTNAPIYLGQDMVTCGITPLFAVADASGAPLPSLGDCRAPCDVVRKQGELGCLDNCAFPTAVALQPNEALFTTWDGLFRVAQQLPAKCVTAAVNPGPVVSCDQAQRIEPGSFTFSARAGSALDCSQTTGQGTCSSCTPGGNGGCATPGSLVSGAMHTTQTTVVLDESFGVFAKPTAGPSAGSADAPAGNGAQAVRTVELIFTN
jgi:hypothetical protein